MSDNIMEIAAEIRKMAVQLGEMQAELARIAGQVEAMQEQPEARQTDTAVTEGTIRLPLNDRYRFLRELFGYSTETMADVIGQLENMTDAAEVTDHLLNRLGWNPESPVVADFITAVCRRFDARPPLLG